MSPRVAGGFPIFEACFGADHLQPEETSGGGRPPFLRNRKR